MHTTTDDSYNDGHFMRRYLRYFDFSVLVLVVGLSFFLLSIDYVILVRSSGGAPHVMEQRAQGDRLVSETHKNFGEVDEGTELHYSINAVNRRGRTVKIFRVGSSCGCTTTPGLEGTEIEPGQSLAVPVQLKARGHRGKISSVVLLLYTIDGGTSSTLIEERVYLQAVVRPRYAVSPSTLDFGTLDDLDWASKAFVVLPTNSNWAAGTKWIEAVSDKEIFRIQRLHDDKQGAASFRVVYDGNLDNLAGLTFCNIAIYGPSKSLVDTIVARAELVPTITSSVDRIVISGKEQGAVAREIVLESKVPFHVNTVSHSSGDLTTSFTQGSDFRCILRVDIQDVHRYIGDKLEVQLQLTHGPHAGQSRRIIVPVSRFASRIIGRRNANQ